MYHYNYELLVKFLFEFDGDRNACAKIVVDPRIARYTEIPTCIIPKSLIARVISDTVGKGNEWGERLLESLYPPCPPDYIYVVLSLKTNPEIIKKVSDETVKFPLNQAVQIFSDAHAFTSAGIEYASLSYPPAPMDHVPPQWDDIIDMIRGRQPSE